MSEARHVTLASTSNAEDAAWLAVAAVIVVAGHKVAQDAECRASGDTDP